MSDAPTLQADQEPRRLIKHRPPRGGFGFDMPDAPRPRAALLVDGRFILWQALPTCLARGETPQMALEAALKDLADAGRKVERIKWL